MQQCEKCNSGGKGFCPVTFGLALGLTCALGVLVCTAWVMWFGMPEMMAGQTSMHVAESWSQAGIWSVYALLKGFVGGFVFALIYDLICCCKSKCCGKCSCCSSNKK